MKKSKSQKTTVGKPSAVEKEISDDLSGKPDLPEDFLIVGIGASAGGIQALQEFFAHVPADSGMAYVVILHLSPDYDSRLAEVLQTVAAIPVRQVTEKVRVEPNCVYVVPPNEHLEMFDGHIVVTTNTSIEERRAPVDIFFRTLAESHHARAVAVVLSGTGANGSMGIKRIKERGGAAFVQNPREAEFSEMPRNSIATDLIDQILNVAHIPERIIAYKESLGKVEIAVEPEVRPEDQQYALREIFTTLRLRTGHDFSNYKRPTVLRRIERRINVFNLPDLTAYAAFVRDNRDEATALLKDLLISVTNFFRDRQSFEYLEAEILPKIFHGKTPEDQVRIWVAGCATGEEAYSLAMLCAERTLSALEAPTVQIFASDIDERAIAVAREGFYTLNDAADVSPERLRRFFTKEDNGFRIRRELREMVLFANHNVIKDPPFSKLDLATCRNMLIYLNQTAQERVMETFHFALNPGGYLFLGNSESVDGAGDLYATVSKENHIFQSRLVSGRVFSPMPAASSGRFQNRESVDALTAAAAPPAKSDSDKGGANTPSQRQSFGDLHQQLLEQYAPPSIVVNEEYDILHLSENAGRFLQIVGGEPTKNLLKLIRPELRLELRAGLYQAVRNQTSVEIKNLKINAGAGDERIDIYARPVLQHSEDMARGFILVLFKTVREGDDDFQTNAKTPSEELNSLQEPLARQLEEELMRTKSRLRGTIEQFEIQAEELKASNEELQAMNEELRSAAEELETSKEELQSVNEELVTVNQELKVKLEELSLSNSDFQNLINSTDTATIFLDRSFRVHTFTPAATRIFNLIPADVGRPLTDITHRIETEELLSDAEKVLDSLQTVEREIRTTDERIYLMRVLPYRTAEDRINGIVATFLDITERKRAEESMRESEELFRSVSDAVPSVIYDWNVPEDKINRSSELQNLLGFSSDDPRTQTNEWWKTRLHPDDAAPAVEKVVEKLKSNDYRFEDEYRLKHRDGHYVWVSDTGVLLRDEKTGEVTRWIGSTTDITERKEAEAALRASEGKYRALFNSIDEGFCTIEVLFDEGGKPFDYRLLEANPAFERQTGLADVMGKTILEIVPGMEKFWFEVYGEVASTGEPQRFEHYTAALGRFYDVYAFRIGEPAENRVAVIFNDITERHRIEQTIRESEERLRLATEASEMATWEWNLLTDEVFWNKRHFTLFGMKSRENPLDADVFFKHVHPDDRICVGAALKKAIAEKSIFETDFRAVLDNDDVRWMSGYGRVVEEATNGEPVRMSGVMFDITERKEAEQALRESEIRYRAIVGQSTAGITELNLNGDHAFANLGYCETLGYTEAELLKINICEITHPDDYAQCLELFRDTIETGAPHITEKRIIRKDGTIVWITESISLITDADDDPLRVATIAIDITNRRRAEEALRESDTRLRLLIESASDYAIFTTTTDGLIDSWNTGAEKVFGWTEAEAIGEPGAIIFTPEDLKKSVDKKEMKTALRMGRAPDERFHLRKDGSRFYASGVMTVLKNEDGAVQGFVKIAFDMTERIEAEKSLREKEMLQKLVSAQENERKRIARDLHDELGQLLIGLRLKLESVRKLCDDNQELCDTIGETQIIAKQLDAGIDFLAWELRPAALDDFGLRAALIKYIKEWSRYSGIKSEFLSSAAKLERLSPEVEINLYRIVQEVLNNVHKHAKAKTVEVSLEKRGKNLIVLIIADNGKGFNVKSKMNRTKGIGLIGMHERAVLVGGSLEIESAVGKGTTVFIRVPTKISKKGEING